MNDHGIVPKKVPPPPEAQVWARLFCGKPAVVHAHQYTLSMPLMLPKGKVTV